MKLFFGGLNAKTQVRAVSLYFRQFGKVKSLSLIRDSKTGISKGYGFVRFESKESVVKVLQTRQHVISETVVDVQLAKCQIVANKTYDKRPVDKTIFVGGLPEDVEESNFLNRSCY